MIIPVNVTITTEFRRRFFFFPTGAEVKASDCSELIHLFIYSMNIKMPAPAPISSSDHYKDHPLSLCPTAKWAFSECFRYTEVPPSETSVMSPHSVPSFSVLSDHHLPTFIHLSHLYSSVTFSENKLGNSMVSLHN